MTRLGIGELHEESASEIFFRATAKLKQQLETGVERGEAIATADTIIRANDFVAREAASDPQLEDERVTALQGVVPAFEERFAQFENGEETARRHPLSWGQMTLDILGT